MTTGRDNDGAGQDARATKGRAWAKWLGLAVFLTIAAGAGLFYYQTDASRKAQRQARLAVLEREGPGLVENHRWQEAAAVYAEIDALAPGSEAARLGRRNIESGMAEEQNQFVGEWRGQANAEFEAGRLDEAQAANQQIIKRYPAEPGALAMEARITAARARQARQAALAGARQQLAARQWEAAISACRGILANAADDAEALAILNEASTARDRYAADQTKAQDLLARASARDHGEYDAQAMAWLREAVALAPDRPEIAARVKKMAAYSRTLRVPEDFATPGEALAAAHDNDKIILAEQTWNGVLVVNAAIELIGAGSTKTIVECPASEGCALTIGPDAKGVRISGITFRHESFKVGERERFSAALVRGGSATFVDCQFLGACGHGLAVIEQGTAHASHCRFCDNGWNGAAASGRGCLLDISDSEALNNDEHGIESWNGAAASLSKNRCEGNSRNGIHIDNGAAAATLDGNQLIANREFGLVLDSAGSGKISGNQARANLLGGLVIRAAAAALPATGNQATFNQGPGLVLEKGLAEAAYAGNSVSQNSPPQILAGATLAQPEEPAAVAPNKEAAAPPKPER